MTNIAVFASGTGSNAVNLVKAFNAGSRIHVALCLTDRENAPVIEKMKELGVETIFFPRSVWRENPQVILEVLRSRDIQVIALAGFLCFVADDIVNAFEGRILNIHPSLLPAYGGKGMHGANVHKAVIEAGEDKSGATVHVVTTEIDAGPIVVQREVAVLPDDTPESLEAKVHEIEYQIFPEAVMKIAAGLNSPINASQPTTINAQLTTPPPVPKSVDDAWAEALGVPNNVPEAPRPPKGGAQAKPTQSILPLQGAGGPNLQGAGGLPQQTIPPTYLAWSIVMTILCCTIPGIVAIVYSSQVSSRFQQGDMDGAWRSSRSAEIWIIVSFVLGVITNTLWLPLMIAGAL